MKFVVCRRDKVMEMDCRIKSDNDKPMGNEIATLAALVRNDRGGTEETHPQPRNLCLNAEMGKLRLRHENALTYARNGGRVEV